MGDMTGQRLTKRTIANLPAPDKPRIIYDSELKGFGLRLTPGSTRNPQGSRTWIVEYRPGAGGRGVAKKRISLGSVEALTPDKARDAARTMLASIRLGSDPNAARAEERAAKSIAELEPLYTAEWNELRKPGTVTLYSGYWRNHILPALGSMTARSVTSDDVARLRRKVGAQWRTTSNRIVTLLTHFYGWAAKNGFVPKGFNPCADMDRYKEAGRERYLTSAELTRLGAAIRTAEDEGIPWREESARSKHAPVDPANRRSRIDAEAADALRMLLFTGARLREVLNLRWADYDRERQLLFLEDSKTGRKTVVLGQPAVETLEGLWTRATMADGVRRTKPRAKPASLFVFPSADGQSPKADLKRPWALVTRHADLPGLRIHDLRHSFASVGAGAGLGLPVIGRMLGHSSPSTTARYAHLDADPVRNATNLIANAIDAALRG